MGVERREGVRGVRSEGSSRPSLARRGRVVMS